MAEINIPIKAEIQELLDKLNLVKKDIENISTSAKEAGATISKGFSGNNITSTNKELKRTNGLIEDIEEAIKEWDIAKKKSKIPRYYVDWLKKNHPEKYEKYVTTIRLDLQNKGQLKSKKRRIRLFRNITIIQGGRCSTSPH